MVDSRYSSGYISDVFNKLLGRDGSVMKAAQSRPTELLNTRDESSRKSKALAKPSDVWMDQTNFGELLNMRDESSPLPQTVFTPSGEKAWTDQWTFGQYLLQKYASIQESVEILRLVNCGFSSSPVSLPRNFCASIAEPVEGLSQIKALVSESKEMPSFPSGSDIKNLLTSRFDTVIDFANNLLSRINRLRRFGGAVFIEETLARYEKIAEQIIMRINLLYQSK